MTEAGREPIDARTYRHPSLAQRRVVRLEPRSIGAAIDLEMAVHGFEAEDVRGGVSVGPPALEGFVAWVALHDAENVRVAITQRRELERALRKGRSKPGHAKDAIEALVKKMASAAPTWVAPFCDEASRGMTTLGNATYAALFFSRARQAERATAARRPKGRDADAVARLYLDAALRGALSAKEITHYVDDVVAHEGSRGAYARLRELLVRRTLGGVPPWSSAMSDLAKLAPGGEREKAEDLERLAAELVGAPAMARAPIALWQGLVPALARLASRDASLHETLLGVVPAMSRRPHEAWLGILERTGSLAHLTSVSSPEALAAWITRTIEAVSDAWADVPAGLLDVISRGAARLVATGVALRIATPRAPEIDLSLAEHVLSLGIAVSIDTGPTEVASVDLLGWARGSRDGERSARARIDPVHAVAHPMLGPLVERAFEHASRSSDVIRASEGSLALASLQQRWLTRQVARVCTAPLAEVRRTLQHLVPSTSRKSFEADRSLHAQLASHDVAFSLARTLRAGLLAELRWPAFDEALDELRVLKGEPAELFGSWPELVAVRGHRLLVIGPRGVLRRADLALAKGERVQRAVTAQGDVLVVVRARGAARAFWLDAKTECRSEVYGAYTRYRVEVPEVGVTSGGPALRAGASVEPPSGRGVASDGTTLWTVDRHGFVELDARTGEKGRASRPPSLEGEGQLVPDHSFVVPAPLGAESSPLGVRGGLLGLRASRVGADLSLERIDGPRARVRGARGSYVLLDVPARQHRLVVSSQFGEIESALLDAAGESERVESHEPREDEPEAPGSHYLHFHVPSDPDGSRALAEIDVETARGLVDLACRGALEGTARARAAIRSVLPAVTYDGLLDAVARESRVAVEISEQLTELAERCDPSGEDVSAGALDDDAVETALGPVLASRCMGGQLERSVKRLVQIFDAFDAGDAPPRWGSFAPTGVDLGALVGRRASLAYLASSPALAGAHRATILALLALLESSRLAAFAPRLRSYRARPGPHAKESVAFSRADDDEQVALVVSGQSLHVLFATEWGPTDWHGIELRREGAVFAPLSDCTLSAEQPFLIDPIEAPLAPLVRERGARSVTPEDVTRFVELTGASRAVGALVLAGVLEPLDDAPEIKRALASYRDGHELKAREIERAWQELGALPRPKRAALLECGLEDLRSMWDAPAFVRRRAETYRRVVGERLAIADELVSRCGAELPGIHEPVHWLRVLAQPSVSPALTVDARWAVVREGELAALDANGRPTQDEETHRPYFDEGAARALAQLVTWSFVALPVGDALRAKIPEVIALVRARLDSPTLIFDGCALEQSKVTGDYAERRRARLAQLDAYGGERFEVLDDAIDDAAEDDAPEHGRDLGLVLLALDYHGIRTHFRPSLMKRGLTDAERALLGPSALRAVTEAWRSEAFDALSARVRTTNVPSGAYEASPFASVPALVAEVARALSASQDAAGYYLQLLATPTPTDENVLRWNAWKSARLEAASVELERLGRVVRGSRARARRTTFLPGEWLDLKKPSLPIERWKLERLGGSLDDSGRGRHPLGAILAPAPIHELFETAWREVVEGRGPALRDARATLGRRGRASGAAVVKSPAAKKAVAKKAVSKKPVAKKPVAKKPVAKKAVAKKAVSKKAVSKKPVAKKAVSKKPVAKKPVAKKPVARRAPKKKARS
jgi:hypothetical protein